MTDTAKGVKVWTVKQVIGIAIVAALAALVSGRLDWAGGWIFTGFLAVQFVLTLSFLVPKNPGLYAERSGLKKGTKKWDIALSVLVAYTPLLLCIVSGLDARNGWTDPLPSGPRIALTFLSVAGSMLVTWAMLANTFFAATVRIQEDRGHTVVTGGPYGYVRHPGYLGAFLFNVGAVGMLGSSWGFALVALMLIPLVIRTALEDATLRRELPGYMEYCARTRFRLIPGIW